MRKITTPGDSKYHYFPVIGESVRFKVKAAHNAQVMLAQNLEEHRGRSDVLIEVLIGTHFNNTVIQKKGNRLVRLEVHTPNILSDSEARSFWITWSDGKIAVGKDGETNPIISYNVPKPFLINYYGICTASGAIGEWEIDGLDEDKNKELEDNEKEKKEKKEREKDSGKEGEKELQECDTEDDCCTDYINEEGWDPRFIKTGPAVWIKASNGSVPIGAIPAGRYLDEQLYIGRVFYGKGIYPGRVIPSKGQCFYGRRSFEYGSQEYEVLCHCKWKWVRGDFGHIPLGALRVGRDEDGEELYIGRAKFENMTVSVTAIGKVQASRKGCLIPFHGKEVLYRDYDILLAK